MDLEGLSAEIQASGDAPEPPKPPPESYEERWIRVLSKGSYEKASAMRGTPLLALALYGIKQFNPPNGNKGRPFATRKFKEKV